MQQFITNNVIQLMTYHAEKIAPNKFKCKTGQIVKLLSKNQKGLSRQELLSFFGQNFDTASFTRRESLRMSVEKIIQRSRLRFDEFNLTIIYNKNTKRYLLDLIHRPAR